MFLNIAYYRTYNDHAFVNVNDGCSLVFSDIQYNRDQENSPSVLKFRENLPACGMEVSPEGFETIKTAKDCKTVTLQSARASEHSQHGTGIRV